MDRSVNQALSGLVPTLSGPLPKDLLDLAVSLLAQSRSKASSLKAEEEIARAYACAHLACERLKQSINLPKILPRPPCPPRVYQKLYRYLDSALPARERRITRPSRTNDPYSTPTSSPAKIRTPAKANPVGTTTPKRKTPQRISTTVTEAPQWVMPAIRQVCRTMGAPAAPPHVFAGVSSIISLSPPSEVKISALIIAVYFLVMTRLSGLPFSSARYPGLRKQALESLQHSSGIDMEEGDVAERDVDHCMREVKSHRWTEMDWFDNIPAGIGLGEDGVEDETAGNGIDDDEVEERHYLLMRRMEVDKHDAEGQDYLRAGLGTMMQDRVDYLSDDRRRDYRRWKKNILNQIEKLEKGEMMDVEAG